MTSCHNVVTRTSRSQVITPIMWSVYSKRKWYTGCGDVIISTIVAMTPCCVVKVFLLIQDVCFFQAWQWTGLDTEHCHPINSWSRWDKGQWWSEHSVEGHGPTVLTTGRKWSKDLTLCELDDDRTISGRSETSTRRVSRHCHMYNSAQLTVHLHWHINYIVVQMLIETDELMNEWHPDSFDRHCPSPSGWLPSVF